jgi:hypothetical protein
LEVQVPDRSPLASEGIEDASALLDVTNETELREYLGGLVADVVGRSGGRLSASTGRALVDGLVKTAEQTVPTLSIVLEVGMVPVSPRGASPAAMAARVYGLELEGMSAEDRDYEIARQFVRFAQAATTEAAHPQAALPDAPAVNAAFAAAAREFAPGLLPPRDTISPGPVSGPWTRTGNTLVLHGLEASRSESTNS